ncbi:MAG: hypothetical protein D3904_06755 [Candidatus Electrothrix sp. EH2]|nr:hypothetical protein [Candidatus Electrothrix sp. EH2]
MFFLLMYEVEVNIYLIFCTPYAKIAFFCANVFFRFHINMLLSREVNEGCMKKTKLTSRKTLRETTPAKFTSLRDVCGFTEGDTVRIDRGEENRLVFRK